MNTKAFTNEYVLEILSQQTSALNEKSEILEIDLVSFFELYRETLEGAKLQNTWEIRDGVYYCMTVITTIGKYM